MTGASVLIACGVILAQTAPHEFEGARLISLAGSQRAMATGNDAIFINPAGIALGTAYSIEAGYNDDLHGVQRSFNGSILDSQAGPVAAGISYVFTTLNLGGAEGMERSVHRHRVDLALATRIAERAAIGVTGRYLGNGESVGEMDIEAGSFDLFTLDAGVQWQTEIGLSLGAAGYSLTNSDRRESPVGWGAGLGYQIGIFSAEADVRYNAQIGKARWSGGLGVVIANMVPLRAGVAYDLATDSLLVSGGIGYQDSSFGADIAYRQRVVHGTLASDAPGDRILAIAIRVNVF